MAYSIERMPERISIGRETETGVTDVMIDCGAWVSKWPGMTLHAIHTPDGGTPYILQTETVGSVLVWHVTDADTAKPGTGRMEIVGEMDGRRKVSAMVKVYVAERMDGTVGEPPNAANPWADRVVEAAERITGMKVQAETLDAGIGATAEWDGVQGLLTIGVPKGEQGPKGDPGEPSKDAVVDATLTKSGQAADAKVTGDTFIQLKGDLNKLNDIVLTTGINLVNPDDFLIDRRADSDTVVRNGETTTGWISVSDGESYYIIYNIETTTFTRVFGKDSKGNLTSILADNVSVSGKVISIPSDIIAIRLSCFSHIINKGVMIAKGSKVSAYEAYHEKLDISSVSDIHLSQTTFGTVKASGKNLIGKTESGIFNVTLDGSGTGLPESGNNYLRTVDYIPVAYGDTLIFSVNGSKGTSVSHLRSMVTYDKDFNPVRAYMSYPNPFTINKNEHYVRIAYDNKLENVMLEYGDEIHDYEAFVGTETIEPSKNSVRYPKQDLDVMINPWYGKKMVVDGDSITHDQGKYNYWQFVAAEILGMYLDTSSKATYASGWKGVGGSRIANDPVDSTDDPMYNIVLRYMNYPDDADIVLIAGGTNDWAHGNVALGDFDSTDIHTFNGALNTLLPGLKEKYPAIPIIMMTPIKRGVYGSYGANTPQSHLQLTQEQFVDAMIAKCKQYNVYCLDMWSNCPINPNIESMANSLYNRDIDLVHPNAEGHKVMGRTVAGFIRSIN